MNSLDQLETYVNELATAVRSLANYCRSTDVYYSTPQLLIPTDAPNTVHRNRRTILSNVFKLQALLVEPTEFLQHLAGQNQLLASIQWLGEFQVLACIPLSGNVPIKDVADLSGVPETQLCRILRMTATAGFLSEPEVGHVSHTTLSASFVTKPSFLDAVMFLAETVAPTSLQMAVATRRNGSSNRPNESAYNLAFNTSQTFQSVYEQRPKLQRQWPAYLRYTGVSDDSFKEVLSRLNWLSLGNASIVEVDAQSSVTAMHLAELYPDLHFVVQMSEPGSSGISSRKQSISNRVSPYSTSDFSSRDLIPGPTKVKDIQQSELKLRITVQKRSPGTLQSVNDAAVYILRLPSPSPEMSSNSITTRIVSELRAHFGVLRASRTATLILTARLIPEPGTVDPDIEAIARLRDLTMLQLANDGEIEMTGLLDILNSIRDNSGRLVVVDKFRLRDNGIVAFGVKYKSYANHS